MTTPAVPPTLPVLPLPYPTILLPAAHITVPVDRELGQALLTLIQESEAQPAVAAIPLLSEPRSEKDLPRLVLDGNQDENATVLNEWGVHARITRLVRPSALNPTQPYHHRCL